jgi:predicted nucleic acid-binding protein
MIVVADASPLNYLIQINCDGLMRDLYGAVLVPASVIEELGHLSAPKAVSTWLLNLPTWIDVRSVPFREDARLEALDRGEREPIQLAEEQHATLLLIDERLGRSEARRRGISTTGTLGISLAGGIHGLVDPEQALSTTSRADQFPCLARAERKLCRAMPSISAKVSFKSRYFGSLRGIWLSCRRFSRASSWLGLRRSARS